MKGGLRFILIKFPVKYLSVIPIRFILNSVGIRIMSYFFLIKYYFKLFLKDLLKTYTFNSNINLVFLI